MAGLTLRGISKAFGDVPVLNNIDLDIADGEFLTLVGPSGCGKLTLLRIIAGLESQDRGSVSIGTLICSITSEKNIPISTSTVSARRSSSILPRRLRCRSAK